MKMKVGLLKNCLHYYSWEQGTAIIATWQLFTSGVSMIFFVLAVEHTMEIQEMVARDTEDALEREALEDICSNHLNTKKMEVAQHNAAERLISVYWGLFTSIIHFISTILLMYGVLARKRYFMTPWMMVMMTIISALTISLFLTGRDCLFIATLGGKAGPCERLTVCFFILLTSYMWFVVFSTYVSLETEKGLIHTVHNTKKKVSVPAVQVMKPVEPQDTKAFEV